MSTEETRQKMAKSFEQARRQYRTRTPEGNVVKHHDLNPLQPTPAQIKYAKGLGIGEEQLQDMINEAVASAEPTFAELAKPLIKYLNDNHHAHCSILITTTSAEILEGMQAISTNEFLRG